MYLLEKQFSICVNCCIPFYSGPFFMLPHLHTHSAFCCFCYTCFAFTKFKLPCKRCEMLLRWCCNSFCQNQKFNTQFSTKTSAVAVLFYLPIPIPHFFHLNVRNLEIWMHVNYFISFHFTSQHFMFVRSSL